MKQPAKKKRGRPPKALKPIDSIRPIKTVKSVNSVEHWKRKPEDLIEHCNLCGGNNTRWFLYGTCFKCINLLISRELASRAVHRDYGRMLKNVE